MSSVVFGSTIWQRARMNDRVRLFVFGATAAEWTARYGVDSFSHPCSECGRVLTTSIPFVQGALRGLQAPPCECGNKATPFGLVRDPAYGDLFTGGEVRSSKPGSARRTPGRVVPLKRLSGS